MTARLEYRVDSLMNETRRLQQQNDALATENRNLAARSSDLESRITAMQSAPSQPQPVARTTGRPAENYDEALHAFRTRNFTDAIVGFENVLNGNCPEDLADNCHYWIGESYYGMRQYKEALEHFRQVLSYKKSEKKDDAQLMIGNTYWAMGNKAQAREAYNALISTYPASSLVPKAKEKLSRLQ